MGKPKGNQPLCGFPYFEPNPLYELYVFTYVCMYIYIYIYVYLFARRPARRSELKRYWLLILGTTLLLGPGSKQGVWSTGETPCVS